MVASPRALEAYHQRSTPVANYYADWSNWLPVLEAYEARRPGYFGTPAVNLVCALNVSLGQILAEGMEARFQRHRRLSAACKAAVTALGLGQVPVKPEYGAHTMTAPRYPLGVTQSDLLPRVRAEGAILAGGLHKDIRTEYFRIGHMGPSKLGDVLATIGALETALVQCGYHFKAGAGVAAAAEAWEETA
jgi:alanine-glyoxylate transaminase/serine-glyoxylate transaminase/serine-pyruvate transaminase